MCSRPRKPQRKPKPSATEFSRLVEKRRVVQLQFSERVAQRFVVIGKHGKQSREQPSALMGLESGQRWSRPRHFDDRVAHARIGQRLIFATMKPTSPASSSSSAIGFGVKRAELFDFVGVVARDEFDFHMILDAPFHHAHQDHRAAVNVEPRIGKSAPATGFPRCLSAPARAQRSLQARLPRRCRFSR